jgi:hypothetical protein
MSIENPPAFPVIAEYKIHAIGMTLRDYFAGQALAGLTTNSKHVAECHLNDPDEERPPQSLIEKYAEYSYLVADAMLTARQKGTPDE